MTITTFISGWAGFKETLGEFPQDWKFICPFIDFDEDGILNFFRDRKGKNLLGWSTGGHIILKNFDFFSQRFEKILIVAGFTDFTKYVDGRVLRMMERKMATSPETVIRDFHIKAGCSPYVPEQIDHKKLIEGLKFLELSKISTFPSKPHKLTLVQGIFDQILPIKALEDLKEIFPFAKVHKIKGAHCLKLKEIRSLINDEAPEKI